MCGIVGIALLNDGNIYDDLLMPLKRLEYRGYDSVGFESDSFTYKGVGKVADFIENIKDIKSKNIRRGIAHCRWATHGGKTEINAHPHFNQEQSIHAVHNGIIENNMELREMLEEKGYMFLSETDTEIIPHYFDHYHLRQGLSIEQTIQKFFQDIKGTYAVLLSLKGDTSLYAFKKDSPLVLGVCSDRNIVASDIYSFVDKTNQAVFFEDKEYAVITSKNFQFYNENGNPIEKTIHLVEGVQEDTMGDYPHYMIKEINEQPRMVARLLTSLATEQSNNVKKITSLMSSAKRIVFIACGTSYHASLLGSAILSQMGYDVYNVIASESENFHKVDEDTLVFAISQSGETMDIVTSLKRYVNVGAKIVSITNVPYSTIQRQSLVSLNIVAGQEIAVASTKAFTNQVITLLELARVLGHDINLFHLPEKILSTITTNDSIAKSIAKNIRNHEHVFFLGRGLQYPVALEMALKLKEISYIHAEGMMGGEIKHGTIALIDSDVHTPVITLIPNGNQHIKSNLQEVESRGAMGISVSNTNDGVFLLPNSSDLEFAIYSVVVGQLLAYYVALERGCDVDQPRNLAKSVTVL